MRAAKVQASLRIRAVSPEPPLLAHTSSESRGTFEQKARSLAPLNGWACAVKICHDGMLEDTNSLDAVQFIYVRHTCLDSCGSKSLLSNACIKLTISHPKQMLGSATHFLTFLYFSGIRCGINDMFTTYLWLICIFALLTCNVFLLNMTN